MEYEDAVGLWSEEEEQLVGGASTGEAGAQLGLGCQHVDELAHALQA